MTPLRLVLVLLAWMLLVTAACTLIYTLDPAHPPDRPRRTRPLS